MMRRWMVACLIAGVMLGVAAGQGAKATPAGRWRTIDDKTGVVKSELVLWEQDGKIFGKVDKIITPDPANPDHKCHKCAGELKDHEILGWQMIWGLTEKGGEWSGGWILDPGNGTTYRCRMTLEEGGKKLNVRGYIGISLLGRTQYWYRLE